MKHSFCLILVLCLLLTGCGIQVERFKEPVTFYYPYAEYRYFTGDGVIASEEREASGHRDDLSYLLALYLMGPADESLTAPLPRGTRIYASSQTEDTIQLRLSDGASVLDDKAFSIACACLSLTCLDLTDAESVTIESGERSATMTRDMLVLNDIATYSNTEDTK